MEIAKEIWPNRYVTAGHLILSEYREYERGVTAAVNASVQPILDRYIQRLIVQVLQATLRSLHVAELGIDVELDRTP